MIDYIWSLTELEHGWDSYRASPPNIVAASVATILYNSFTIKPSKIKPSVIGGITFIWNGKIFVEIYNDGNFFSVFRYDGRDSVILLETSVVILDGKIKDYFNECFHTTSI